MNDPRLARGLPDDLPALTSVRFFLALGVVLFHLQLTWSWPTLEHTSLIERARLGVDVFFILSGFVLTHVYQCQIAEGRYSHRRFLIARLARIYPAHLLILVFMLIVAGAAVAMGERLDQDRYSALGWLRSAFLIHAWTPSRPVEWNGPSWSLSAEWGAYLLYPLFGWIGLQLRQRPYALIALAIALFVGLDAAYRAAFDQVLLHAEFNIGVLRILPTFLLGLGLYALAIRLNPQPSVAVMLLGFTTLTLLVLMHFGADERAIVAAAGAFILALALQSKAKPGGPMANATLLLLGEASYALYLLHLPAITVWKNVRAVIVGGASSYTMPMHEVAILIGLMIVAACVLHVAFERPVRTWVRARFM